MSVEDDFETVGSGPVVVTKGTRVTFRFLSALPMGSYSIAGFQPKVVAKTIEGEGVIRGIWADDPHGLVNLRFNVELEDGSFVVVPRTGILGVMVGEGGLVGVPVEKL